MTFLILLMITNLHEASYLASSGEDEADLLDEDMDEFEVRGLQLCMLWCLAHKLIYTATNHWRQKLKRL